MGGADDAYDPGQFSRLPVLNGQDKSADDDDVADDGVLQNVKGQTFACELVTGTRDKKLGHHAVNYSVIESFPYMNVEHTQIRFLCFGRKYLGDDQWREAQYQVVITGKRLGRVYARIVAGSRAIIRPTGIVLQPEKYQIDSVSLEETVNISVQEPPEGVEFR